MRSTTVFLLGALLLAPFADAVAQEAPAEAAAEPELGWPREYADGDYRLVVYQPQIESWDDYLTMEAYMAVLLEVPETDQPYAGAIKLRAATDAHLDSRTVFVHDVELVEVLMPQIEGTTAERLEQIVRSTFPDKPVATSLDRILAGLDRARVHTREVQLNDEPPAILVSLKPALLVNLDGDPVWVPTGVDNLSYAVNTNWDLFELTKKKETTYYLRDHASWLVAESVSGPWTAAGKPPKAFSKLPVDDNFRDVRMNVPGTRYSNGLVPEVLVSTRPAELIVIEREPFLVPIPETPILFVDNTESDLFRHIEDNQYYFLTAGRWFKNDDLEGAWSAATGKLPAGFDKIPESHEKGHVLSSVPGTPQAQEAVLEAQIPTVATVSREDAPKEVEVVYTGEPEFRPIEGTSLAYAVNTASDVVRVGSDSYYLCSKGIWFQSATPSGPWEVADRVPDEIYTIPAESPVHHTTYVYAYDSTPTEVVYGYTPGYMGLYVSWGCAVWGTGWYYSPYSYYDPFYYPYPIYYGYPYTYGAGAWYNPSTGFYGRGYSYYGPYGGAGRAAAYNPTTGTYARGGYAAGYGGGTSWGRAYNPRSGVGAAGYRSYDAYSSWGRGVVSRGDEWIKSGYYSDARGSVRGIQGSGGESGLVVRGDQGTIARGRDDLYVGSEGNVYRRGADGWEQYGGKGGEWSPVEGDRAATTQAGRDAARQRAGSGVSQGQKDALRARGGYGGGSLGGLDSSAASRQRGNTRSQQYSTWKSQGGWNSGARGRSYPSAGARVSRGRRR